MFEVDRNNFETEVLAPDAVCTLVDFYGDGCVPCAALKPHIERLEESYGSKIRFVALNTTKARRVAIAQKVMGLPVVAIYKNGEKVEELVKEAATAEAVEAMLQRHC